MAAHAGIIVGVAGGADRALHTHGRRVDGRQLDGHPRLHPRPALAVRPPRIPHQPRVRRPHHDTLLHAVHIHDDDAQQLDILGAHVPRRAVHADGVGDGERVHEHGHRHRPLLGRHVPAAVAHHQVPLQNDDRHHLGDRLRAVVRAARRRPDSARGGSGPGGVDGRLCGGVARAERDVAHLIHLLHPRPHLHPASRHPLLHLRLRRLPTVAAYGTGERRRHTRHEPTALQAQGKSRLPESLRARERISTYSRRVRSCLITSHLFV